MADKEPRKRKLQAGAKRLEQILARANGQIRVVLERLERELKAKSLSDAFAANREALVARVVLSATATYVVTRVSSDILKNLSPRQLEIADLVLLRRLSQKEAAYKLGISPRTLNTHLQRVYTKCREISLDSLLRQLSLMMS